MMKSLQMLDLLCIDSVDVESHSASTQLTGGLASHLLSEKDEISHTASLKE